LHNLFFLLLRVVPSGAAYQDSRHLVKMLVRSSCGCGFGLRREQNFRTMCGSHSHPLQPHVVLCFCNFKCCSLVQAAVNKDRERVLRTGEPSCRTRIVGRAARAGARSLPLVPPQFAPSPAFCSLLLSNGISVLGSLVAGHVVLGSVRAVRSCGWA
jgi:hypothetical protein